MNRGKYNFSKILWSDAFPDISPVWSWEAEFLLRHHSLYRVPNSSYIACPIFFRFFPTSPPSTYNVFFWLASLAKCLWTNTYWAWVLWYLSPWYDGTLAPCFFFATRHHVYRRLDTWLLLALWYHTQTQGTIDWHIDI